MNHDINAEDLESTLTSEQMADSVSDSLVKLLRGQDHPELLCGFLPEGAVGRLEEELCVRIQVAICKAGLPLVFAQKGSEIAAGVIGRSSFGKVIARKIVCIVTKPMARDLEDYIIDDGHEIILNLMDQELQRIANSPVNELSTILTENDEELKELVKILYQKFMNIFAGAIVEHLNREGI